MHGFYWQWWDYTADHGRGNWRTGAVNLTRLTAKRLANQHVAVAQGAAVARVCTPMGLQVHRVEKAS